MGLAAACGDPVHPAADAPPPSADAALDAPGAIDFTETFGPSSADVGRWILTKNPDRIRTLETSGGNPDGYLYGEVALAMPAWSTASTRFQPGVDDAFKRDSVFVGDFHANDIATFSADLDVLQAGNWSSNRTVTLHLLGWDPVTGTRTYEAFYRLPDIQDAPVGWNTYTFAIDARSPTIPAGWQLVRGDGSTAGDAEWAVFMHQIDLVELVFGRPGYAYPSTGEWHLGIDNIRIAAGA